MAGTEGELAVWRSTEEKSAKGGGRLLVGTERSAEFAILVKGADSSATLGRIASCSGQADAFAAHSPRAEMQSSFACPGAPCPREMVFCTVVATRRRPEKSLDRHGGAKSRADAKDLLYVSKLKKKQIELLKAGADLERRTGYAVDGLLSKAAVDRFRFALELLSAAKSAATGPTASFRSATSRAYYAMYHAFRATAFCAHGGDDHEEHTKLPGGIPHDFPSKDLWMNDLKNARLERNRADYDPYPKSDATFRPTADQLIQKAEALFPLVREYLRTNGCRA